MRGRIWFAGDPWPSGHRIEQLAWSGRLGPEAELWFDLHLVSADYDAEDEADHEDGPDDTEDWDSKGVRGDDHRCTLSSTRIVS